MYNSVVSDMTELFQLFGISSTAVKWAMTNGLLGIAILGGLVIIKMVVIPSIAAWMEKKTFFGDRIIEKLEDIKKTLSNGNTDIKPILEDIRIKIYTTQQTQETISTKVDMLLGDQVGNLDYSLSLNLFGNYMHKQHLVALAFFNIRLRNNHIDTQRDVIRERYERKSLELGAKTYSQFGFYSFNNIPLSVFFESEAVSVSYFKIVMDELFSAHERITKNDGLTLEDIEGALDRQLSKLMTSFKNWMENPQKKFSDDLHGSHYKMWTSPKEIEYL